MRQILSLIIGIMSIACYVPYVLAILRRQTKPSKASWIIWACLDTLVLVSMIQTKTLNAQMVGVVAGVWVVVFLVVKRGIPGWTKLDKTCLAGAAVGLAAWQIFSAPLLGIIASLSMLFLGSIPTFVSAKKDPSHEDKTAWTMNAATSALSVIAVPQWTLADAAQPTVFLFITLVMMYLLHVRPRLSERKDIRQ